MTGQEAMLQRFDAVTTTPALSLGLQGYGPDVGCRADLALLRATRLLVLRAGQIVATTPAQTATLHLPGRPAAVDWRKV